jgi:hypothetical protein
MQRPAQLAFHGVRENGERGRDEALHVGRPPSVEAPVGAAQLEGIAGPSLSLHVDDVRVAGEE